jgi:hypothetical protein
VTWQTGRLPAATGVLLPVKQAAFQIGFVPSLAQVGNIVTVVKEAKISGEDDFTGASASATVNDLKTDMPDDSTVGYEKGKVQ